MTGVMPTEKVTRHRITSYNVCYTKLLRLLALARLHLDPDIV